MKLIKDLGMLFPETLQKRKYRYGLYECPLCGNHFKEMTNKVKGGRRLSCGCLREYHGESKTPLYLCLRNYNRMDSFH